MMEKVHLWIAMAYYALGILVSLRVLFLNKKD
jgi:hypothetical protein